MQKMSRRPSRLCNIKGEHVVKANLFPPSLSFSLAVHSSWNLVNMLHPFAVLSTCSNLHLTLHEWNCATNGSTWIEQNKSSTRVSAHQQLCRQNDVEWLECTLRWLGPHRIRVQLAWPAFGESRRPCRALHEWSKEALEWWRVAANQSYASQPLP